MTFADAMFNPEYVNPIYFRQQQALIAQYHFRQNMEVEKAAHAVRELCRAVKNMDGEHQRIAFYTCLAALGEEFGWQNG